MDGNLAALWAFGILVTGIALSSIARYWAEAFKAKWQVQAVLRAAAEGQLPPARSARQRKGLLPAPPPEEDEDERDEN